MSVSMLSISSLGATTTLAGAVSASRNAWSTLGKDLDSGNLSSARSAFATYTRLNANTINSATDTQYVSDLRDLNTALTTGDLTKARSAYSAVSEETKNDPVLAVKNAAASAKQTGAILSALISPGTSRSRASFDPYATILDTAYSQILFSTDSSSSVGSLFGTRSSGSSTSYLQKIYGSDNSSEAAQKIIDLMA